MCSPATISNQIPRDEGECPDHDKGTGGLGCHRGRCFSGEPRDRTHGVRNEWSLHENEQTGEEEQRARNDSPHPRRIRSEKKACHAHNTAEELSEKNTEEGNGRDIELCIFRRQNGKDQHRGARQKSDDEAAPPPRSCRCPAGSIMFPSLESRLDTTGSDVCQSWNPRCCHFRQNFRLDIGIAPSAT